MIQKERKPVAGEATGSLSIEALAGKFDRREDSRNLLNLQAAHVRGRWPWLSLETACVVAAHCYGGRAA